MHTSELLQSKTITNTGRFDMLSKICIIDYDKINIDEWILIDESTIFGLDMISNAMYGSDEYVWVLLKFNRLNMFEMNVGDVIAIPNLNDFRNHSKFIDANVTTKFQNINRTNTTPSQKQVSSKNYTKSKNGNVVF